MRSKLEINRVSSVVLNYFINPQIKSLNYLFLNVNSSQAEAAKMSHWLRVLPENLSWFPEPKTGSSLTPACNCSPRGPGL